MIKIWGKILAKEKIAKSTIVEATSFFDMLMGVCQKLNIPTPVLLDKHVMDFNRFRRCEFKPNDFIEAVVFDRFVLQLMRGE